MSINLTYQRFSEVEFSRVTASQAAWQTACAPQLPGLDLAQLQAMIKNPSEDSMQKLIASLQAKAADTTRLDIDKWWHVFSYLLTGSHEIQEGHQPGAPLHNVIFGGTPTAIQASYGPVRALAGDSLRDVSVAVAELSVDSFLEEWDIDEMQRKDIYARPDDDDREIAAELFERLKTFFAEAHASREVVVVYSH